MLNNSHLTCSTEIRSAILDELKYYWRILTVYIAAFYCIVLIYLEGLAYGVYLKHYGLPTVIIAAALMIVLLHTDRGKHIYLVSYRTAVSLALLTAFSSCFLICGTPGTTAFLVTFSMMGTATAYCCRRLHQLSWGWVGQYTLGCMVTEFALCTFLCLRYINNNHGLLDDCFLVLLMYLPLPIMLITAMSLIKELIRKNRMIFYRDTTDYHNEEVTTHEDGI